MEFNQLIEFRKAFSKYLFYDEGHKYFNTDTGERYGSATGFISQFVKPFDSKWEKIKAIEYNVSRHKVKEIWDKKKFIGQSKGTITHNFGENRWNGKILKDYLPDKLFKIDTLSVSQFYRDVEINKKLIERFISENPHLIPIFLEPVVGDDKIRKCGQIDVLVWDTNEQGLFIYDYKTDKEFRTSSNYKFLPPINHVSNCQLSKYAIQTEIYKYMIEQNTSIKIMGKRAVWLHTKNNEYHIIELPDMRKELDLMIKTIK